MTIKYIDIHSHLNHPDLFENRKEILSRMSDLHVATITIGTGFESSKLAIQIAQENPGICFAVVGVHPCDEPSEIFDEKLFEELALRKEVVAIGETGLDYFRSPSQEEKNRQVKLFEQHIFLAQKIGKPLMLHVRASKGTDDAYYDALEILKNTDQVSQKSVRGWDALFSNPFRVRKNAPTRSKDFLANFHFFSGSKACMEKIIASGFTISVDGPITFSNDYDEMVRACPLEKIMIETDAPFAAPKPYRGKPGEPWMVIEVAKKIAELKNLDLEIVRTQLLENAKSFFGLEF